MLRLLRFRTPPIANVVVAAGIAVLLICSCSTESDLADIDDGSVSGFVRTAEISKGRRLYKQNGCYVCHGEQGKGDGKLAHTLDPKPRDLADAQSYRKGVELEQIMETVRKGIGVGKVVMPGYGHLSKADRRCIARYLVSLQSQKIASQGDSSAVAPASRGEEE